MKEYLNKRPLKKVFKSAKIIDLRDKAIGKVKSKLLPDNKIFKILLIGSSVKDSFGEYEPPGFRGSLYSDFDFIVYVEDDYEIPKWLNKEPSGKPFPDDSMNLSYRYKKFIDDKYNIEVFFLKQRYLDNSEVQKQGELAGIPMTPNTKHKHIIIYEKQTQ